MYFIVVGVWFGFLLLLGFFSSLFNFSLEAGCSV